MLWRKVLKEAMNLNFLRFFTGTKPRVIAVDERPSDDDIEGPKDERAGDAQAPASGKELRSDALLSTFTDWPRLYQIDALESMCLRVSRSLTTQTFRSTSLLAALPRKHRRRCAHGEIVHLTFKDTILNRMNRL